MASERSTQTGARTLTRGITFTEHLKRALESIDQPEALGRESPLAAPYFLGGVLHGAETSDLGRGQALCDEIQRAVESMWRGPLPDNGEAMLAAALADGAAGGRYDCLILELNYFKQRFRPAPSTQAEIYHDILNIARPTHDRHLRGAVERLGALLLQRVRPAVRPEQPIAPPTLIGREASLEALRRDLEQGKAVSLTGPGGIGKTSLAAAVTDQWDSPAVFWYTFRPTLNDQVESLLFALGHFLHVNGASTLWHQLVADGGRIKDANLGVGLATGDLESLAKRPLLCFDELDFLRPLTPSQPDVQRLSLRFDDVQYMQVLELLDSLRGNCAILLIGQRAYWESDAVYALAAWSEAEVARWLNSLSIAHTEEDVRRLHQYTGGNPRLAELCAALYQAGAGATLHGVLDHLPHFQALLPLWLRLERRLPAGERVILQALSVFRAPAPADVWFGGAVEEAEALTQLIRRRLVHHDQQGGVALLPALSEVIYTDLPPEAKDALHANAAIIRSERGEYTAAAYHWARAGRPEAAVASWYPQRESEIHRGQAGAALAIFGPMAAQRLDGRQHKELLLLRGELYELAGEPARVVEELAQAEWPADDPMTPEAHLRMGQASEAQGQPDVALEVFQRGLDAVTQLLREGAQLHVQRSLTYMRQREMQQAWREANLARFHAETMMGVVHDERGDYDIAHTHYINALHIADEADYPAGTAQTHHYLAMLAGRRHAIEEALSHFEQAMAFYDQVGDRVNREIVRSNFASAYIQSRRFDEALEPAEMAFRFFQAMGNPFRTAQNASNLAEAHAELGNLDQAEHYAELVLQQEEPQSHPYALYTLGTVYKLRSDWERAVQHYDQSRQMAEMNDDAYLLAFAWRALGEVYLEQERMVDARAALEEALGGFKRLGIDEEARATEEIQRRCDAKYAQCEA